MQLSECSTQVGVLALGQQDVAVSVRGRAPVAHAGETSAIVSACDLADPIGEVACDASHSRCSQTASKEPEEVSMAPLHRVATVPLARFEFVVGQVGLKMDVSWHASVLQQLSMTPCDTASCGTLVIGRCRRTLAACATMWSHLWRTLPRPTRSHCDGLGSGKFTSATSM